MAHPTDTSTTRRTRRRRALAVTAAGLLLGLGAAGTALAVPEEEGVAGTPCSAAAKACVDLENEQAWILDDGAVSYGPVRISHGGQGAETPTGDFTVYDKDSDHHSAEFDGAPMPWSVFFAPGGVAFHEGDRNSASAGCVKLKGTAATIFYSKLDLGDRVEVR